ESRADDPEIDRDNGDSTHEIADNIAYKRLAIVNVVFVGQPGAGDREWVLIDAGLPGFAGAIKHAACERFGEDSRPAAILMTHGHFDHVGSLERLADDLDAPIYAHLLEQPYLDGRSAYPPPDPTVGGGLMALTSPLFPPSPVNVSRRLRLLPDDHSAPHMNGWRWIHTPGHTPGHVSFWREGDRSLIVGDAFVTTRQESAYAAIFQKPECMGRRCITLRIGTARVNRCKRWPRSSRNWLSPDMVARWKAWRCDVRCTPWPAISTKSSVRNTAAT